MKSIILKLALVTNFINGSRVKPFSWAFQSGDHRTESAKDVLLWADDTDFFHTTYTKMCDISHKVWHKIKSWRYPKEKLLSPKTFLGESPLQINL